MRKQSKKSYLLSSSASRQKQCSSSNFYSNSATCDSSSFAEQTAYSTENYTDFMSSKRFNQKGPFPGSFTISGMIKPANNNAGSESFSIPLPFLPLKLHRSSPSSSSSSFPSKDSQSKAKHKEKEREIAAEREKVREFWLTLPEEKRKTLVFHEKLILLKMWKERQRLACNCKYCEKKRALVEEQIELLYLTYYHFLNDYTKFLLSNKRSSKKMNSDDFSDLGHIFGNFSGLETVSFGTNPTQSFKNRPGNFVDEILKCHGRKILEIVEQIVERKMLFELGEKDPHSLPVQNIKKNRSNDEKHEGKRDEKLSSAFKHYISETFNGSLDDKMQQNIQSSFNNPTHDELQGVPNNENSRENTVRAHISTEDVLYDSDDFYEDDSDNDDSYEDDDYVDSEDESIYPDCDSRMCQHGNLLIKCSSCESTRNECEQFEEIFHIIAAMTFEQRVTVAYHEHIAQENMRKLIEEEEEREKEREKQNKQPSSKQSKKDKKKGVSNAKSLVDSQGIMEKSNDLNVSCGNNAIETNSENNRKLETDYNTVINSPCEKLENESKCKIENNIKDKTTKELKNKMNNELKNKSESSKLKPHLGADSRESKNKRNVSIKLTENAINIEETVSNNGLVDNSVSISGNLSGSSPASNDNIANSLLEIVSCPSVENINAGLSSTESFVLCDNQESLLSVNTEIPSSPENYCDFSVETKQCSINSSAASNGFDEMVIDLQPQANFENANLFSSKQDYDISTKLTESNTSMGTVPTNSSAKTAIPIDAIENEFFKNSTHSSFQTNVFPMAATERPNAFHQQNSFFYYPAANPNYVPVDSHYHSNAPYYSHFSHSTSHYPYSHDFYYPATSKAAPPGMNPTPLSQISNHMSIPHAAIENISHPKTAIQPIGVKSIQNCKITRSGGKERLWNPLCCTSPLNISKRGSLLSSDDIFTHPASFLNCLGQKDDSFFNSMLEYQKIL